MYPQRGDWSKGMYYDIKKAQETRRTMLRERSTREERGNRLMDTVSGILFAVATFVAFGTAGGIEAGTMTIGTGVLLIVALYAMAGTAMALSKLAERRRDDVARAIERNERSIASREASERQAERRLRALEPHNVRLVSLH